MTGRGRFRAWECYEARLSDKAVSGRQNKVKTLKAISSGMANHLDEAGRLARKFMRSNQSTELSRHLEDLAEQMNRESEAKPGGETTPLVQRNFCDERVLLSRPSLEHLSLISISED